MAWDVATFYMFVSLPDYRQLRAPLQAQCQGAQLRGTILLATEGINATLAGHRESIQQVLEFLRQDSRFEALEPKWSRAEAAPFGRMKVRLKREIVTLGEAVDPTRQAGTYVAPEAWNQLIEDPEVLVIDTRNDYEVGIGSFEGAVNPQTESFRDFPRYVQAHLDPQRHRRIAMFCTGGIRCEKASAYLLNQGFEEVYHLQGGILKYLETVPAEESRWQGDCFVFDERVAVSHSLQPGRHGLCHACGHPVSPEDMQADSYVAGQSCPHCWRL